MIVPTRRLWILLLAGALLPLGSIFVPALAQFLVPYNLGLLVVTLVSGYVAKRQAKGLALSRTSDSVLSNRVVNRISLALSNEGESPVSVRLRDGAPEVFEQQDNDFKFELGPRDTVEGSYHVRPIQRGVEVFEDAYVRVLAPGGLCEVEHRLPAEQEIHVYPNVLALRDFDLLKQRGRLSQAGQRRSRYRAQGTDFDSMRDYVNDSFRLIDWKASARRNKLMVRQYTTERNQPVIVCMDCGRAMLAEVNGVSKLDYALDAALLVLHAAIDGGDIVGFMSFDNQAKDLILPKKGRSQLGLILNSLHDLQAQPLESNYAGSFLHLASMQRRRALIIIFSDAEDRVQADRLSRAIAPLTKQHLVFVARIIDPGIRELQQKPLVRAADVYDRAAVLWYESERRSATAGLQIAGVQNIEAEPAELAQALVNAYLMSKERVAL